MSYQEAVLANKYFQRIVKNKAAEAFILNFIFLLFAILFCEQKYEVSDDFIMETILSGAYGDTVNPHMLFVNTLYGYLLLPLYLLFPGISWYLISLIFWGFLACTTITSVSYTHLHWIPFPAKAFM